MSYLRLINTAREQFHQLPAGKNVLILHPQFRYHNVLIDAVAGGLSHNVIYVTLYEAGMSLDGLWRGLADALQSSYQVDLPPLEDATPGVAAEQFVQAVGKLTPVMVVLAEYDHAVVGVHDFVVRAADLLGDRGAFLLDGRTWPEQLIGRIDTPSSVAVLPVSPDDMLLDYLVQDTDRVLLEVRALGAGQVLINGRQVAQWDGALPRALFFYFVDRGMTTRDEVFQTFWPELSTREATNVFHVTKRKISEILNVDLTVYSSGFYRISPTIDLHYDVVSFVEAVQESAVASAENATHLLDRAIGLHERDFLGDFEQPWAIRRRHELRSTYVDALTARARLYEEKDMIPEALGLYNRAFGAFPQREDLARSQMRLYQQTQQSGRAMAVYDRLVAELESSLGVAPSPETRSLADEVRQQATSR